MNDTQQVEYLANKYADTIFRLSYTYLKNTHDAQDVCQNVFVKLLTTPLKKFENEEHEKAYILRMTANACKNVLKSPWRRRICTLDVCADIPAPEEPDNDILLAVNALPAHYRSVIHLYYYEGYHAEEIADILGISASAVYSRLNRGREKLRKLLERGHEHETSE